MKIFIIELHISDYLKDNLEQINTLISSFYENKLKRNATKGFLKWCLRKIESEEATI